MSWHRWEDGDLLLELRVQPRASRDEVIGPHGDRLRLRLTAPPVEGRANEHLRRFLAGLFGVPPSAVTVERGLSGREKRVRVRAPRRLPEWLPRPPRGPDPPRNCVPRHGPRRPPSPILEPPEGRPAGR